ncbi:MAG: hypothetical protein ABR568_04050 [Pyrinomonadaceae bacterium]
MSLEKVAQSLAEQLPAAELNKHLQDRRRLTERWISILLGSTFTIFVGAVLWALVYKIIIIKGEVLEGLIFLAVFVGMVAALLLVIYRESLLEAAAKRQLAQPKLPLTEPTGKLLPESALEPIPSVTEGTTELLFAEKKSGAKES